jgi:DNA end-binding protein Ku
MARPIWKGQISFGLVNIPVTLYSAEHRSELHFHMVDSRNKARIRFERVNEEAGQEVPWDQIVKGYEYGDDKLLLLNDEDFKKADVKASSNITIENFIDRQSLDCVYFDKPYMLVPVKKSEKGYVLLRETLKRTNTVGIAKVVIRTRQYVAALLPRGNGMLLNLLRYHGEMKDPKEFGLPAGSLERYEVSKREVEMAEQFVKHMTTEWDPSGYKDVYRDNLMKWINKRIAAGGKEIEVEEPEEPQEKGDVDIMELLSQSMKMKPKANAVSHPGPRKRKKAVSTSR